jgi:hypothetical protein
MDKSLYGRYLILMLFRTDLRHEPRLAIRDGEQKPEDIDLLYDLKHHWSAYARADRIDFVDIDGTTTTLRIRRKKPEWQSASLVTIDDIKTEFKQKESHHE